MIDSATHDIGVVKFLVGKKPVSIYSNAGSLVHSKEDHAVIVLDFGGYGCQPGSELVYPT